MKKIVFIFICGSLLLFNKPNNNFESISEEVTPNWNNNIIESLDYRMLINKGKDKISYKTKIIESINHYIDTSKRDEFIINLKFMNNSHEKYYLKKIVISNKEEIIKNYNYNKKLDYTIIPLKIDKNTLEQVIQNKQVVGMIKIIIEK